jgi:acyl-CoA reductase-like NAD-dependent aldehyde dehydrogenase
LAYLKVNRLVEDSLAKGANLVTGGKPVGDLGGSFYEPTLISGVNTSMDIAKEEIFGPIASVIK